MRPDLTFLDPPASIPQHIAGSSSGGGGTDYSVDAGGWSEGMGGVVEGAVFLCSVLHPRAVLQVQVLGLQAVARHYLTHAREELRVACHTHREAQALRERVKEMEGALASARMAAVQGKGDGGRASEGDRGLRSTREGEREVVGTMTATRPCPNPCPPAHRAPPLMA